MDERDWLAQRFQEEHRRRLRALAYRMLGSTSQADDALQEAWIRLSRSNAAEINNLQAWLLTVVGRVALNMLRSRKRGDARSHYWRHTCRFFRESDEPRSGSRPGSKVSFQAAEAYSTRCLNRSNFPRPYIERFMSLSLFTRPSICP